MQEALKIFIKYTNKDLRAYSFAMTYGKYGGGGLVLLGFPILLLAIAIITIILDQSRGLKETLFLMVPLLIIIGMLLLPGVLIYYVQIYSFKRSKLLGGLQCYEFHGDQIRSSSRNGTFSIAWSDIYKVRELKPCFLIYQSPAKIYVIPRRCFSDQEQLERFLSILEDNVDRKKLKIRRYRLGKSRPDSSEGFITPTAPKEDNSCGAQLMEIEFVITKKDYIGYFFRQYYTKPSGLVITGLGVYFIYNYISKVADMGVAIIGSLITGAFLVFLIPVILYINILRQFDKDTVYRQPYLFRFFDDCYTLEHPSGNNRIFWRDLVKINETRQEYIFFVTTRMVHFIPKRVFAGREADLQALSSLIRQKRKNTKTEVSI